MKKPNTVELQINPNNLEKENCTLQFDRIFMLICTEKNIFIFNKRNSPLTKLECISKEQRMFTLKNPNLIPWAKGYSNPNPSGLRPSRIWIGMGPWPSGYQFGFSKVNILRSLDSSNRGIVSLNRSKGFKILVFQTLKMILSSRSQTRAARL